jgi:signal transduction histidine kinase
MEKEDATMYDEILPTKFLPAERNSPEVLSEERRILESSPLFQELLDSMPQYVMVLDARRQIVFANVATTRAVGRPERELVGLRPGEALGCIRADEPGGCGTTEYCRLCGAGRSLLGIAQGRDAERDCRILRRSPKRDLDLCVRTTRLEHQGLKLTVFSATDVSGESRRRALERLFFHDILNTAGAMSGISELLPDSTDDEFDACCRLLRKSSDLLLDQIIAQRDLARAESGEYVLRPSPCPMKDFLETIAKIAQAHPVAEGRTVAVEPGAEAAAVVTDRGLLMRVIGNMLKNALEAEPRGATVRLGCAARADGGVEIWVRNPSVMPRQVQLQLFQRLFSTKGDGRGLGTYSMRLLTEAYLNGSVTFSSEEGRGTEFRVRLPARTSAERIQPPAGLVESSYL